MPSYEELNGTQQELYGKLQAAMEEHENIIDLLTGFSKEDVLKILTTVKCIEFKDGEEHTLTPLGCAINLINQEVSQKSIKAIIDVAQDNDMLEKVFASIRKDHLNKTKDILEILENQEQDEEQKAKIDDWLKILAKSISSCKSKDDPSKIGMYDRVKEICKEQEIGK